MASRPLNPLTIPALAIVRFPGRMPPIWLALGFLIAVDVAWLLASPLRLSSATWQVLAGLLPLIMVGAWGKYRVTNSPRLEMLIGGLTFLLCAWPAMRLYNHLTMSTGYPLADETLARADQLLGFNWTEYVSWLDRHKALTQLMDLSYSSLTGYTIVLFLCLLLGRQPKQRCQELIALFLSTGIICSTIGMFFPAEAAAVFYQVSPEMLRNVDPRVGAYHIDHLQALRTDPGHILTLNNLPGLVTFPSFHTAMGIIAIYCARGTPWLFWPSLTINLTMIASTPLFGSHYLVDVIAGAAVSIGVILSLRYFSPSPTRVQG